MATKRFFMAHNVDFDSDLNLNELLPHLNKQLLTSDEMEKLMLPSRTRKEKILELIKIMCIKGDQAPSLFIECVRGAAEHLPHSNLSDKLESWLLQNSATDTLATSSGSEPTQQPTSRANTIQGHCVSIMHDYVVNRYRH